MQTIQLVASLKWLGYQINTICYFEYDKEMVEAFNEAGSEVRILDLKRGLSFLRIVDRLQKELREEAPDVVHVQYMAPGFLPILAARLAGVKKVVATVHQPHTIAHGKFSKLLLRTAAWMCTRFISVSKNVEESWFGSSHLFNSQIPLSQQPHHFTIYNSVDIEKIESVAESKKNETNYTKLNNNSIVIGAVARLSSEKGIDLLVRAFKNIYVNHSQAYLHVVGGGPDELAIRRLIKIYKIEDRCVLFGAVQWEKAIQLLAQMDVVVVPSRFEGFGLTAAEAMALSKPVIASDVNGLPEVLTHKKTGLLVPPNDVGALERAVLLLLNDPTARTEMGKNGREKCEQEFSRKVYDQRIHKLYKELELP